MLRAHRVDQVRAAEEATGDLLRSGALMQRAAAGLAAVCLRRLADGGGVYGRRVVVLTGSGDNGGDALYAGARLAARGAAVVAVPAGSRLHEAGMAALRSAGGRVLPTDLNRDRLFDWLQMADLVLDGLVGIGARGALREPAAAIAAVHEAAGAGDRTVAVDVPSGVDAATGAVEGVALRAACTVTFGTVKPGLLVLPGSGYVGDLQLVPIGLDLPEPDLIALSDADVAERLPQPGLSSSKYTRGVVGVAAGSEQYPGAAVLSSGGALHGGAGYVRFASTAHPAEQVRLRFPEVVVTEVAPDDPAARAEGTLDAGRVQAWVVGSGLGTDESAAAVVRALLETDLPVLVDADGLSVAAEDPDLLRSRRGRPTLVTPHEGEFARLIGGDREDVTAQLTADRLGTVRRAAADLGVTVLLKGSTTLVVTPEGEARVNRTGTGWLATAGSGDVLSGLCGALLASGLDPLEAGSVGAHLHGLAGRLAPVPVAAEDVLAALPKAWAAVAAAGS
jgi:ADP-dependent NAD(P)H-hydrate dehydratase / NAD(P)H-hydrate epimerase